MNEVELPYAAALKSATHSRRSVLKKLGAATLTVFSTGRMSFAAGLSVPTETGTGALLSQIQSVYQQAQDLGVEIPSNAPGESDIGSLALDISSIVDGALEKQNIDPEAAKSLASEAGLLLSQLNASNRDPVNEQDFNGAPPSMESLAAEYSTRFEKCMIQKAHANEVNRAAKLILSKSYRDRYAAVESDTGVPWYVIGALHYREASLNFLGHLHNGDFLRAKTVQVPRGRPAGKWPPSPWDPNEAWRLSAVDALKLERFDRVKAWTVEQMLYKFESYNGWGYRSHPGFSSPYLWNYTQYYTGGGYPCDHCWSDSYISKQAGLVSIIHAIKTTDPSAFEIKHGI